MHNKIRASRTWEIQDFYQQSKGRLDSPSILYASVCVCVHTNLRET